MTRRLDTTWATRTQAARRADDEGSGHDHEVEPEEEPQPEPQQEQPLLPDQVVADDSFAAWGGEEAFRRVKAAFEAAFATVEAAAIERSRESAENVEHARFLVAAERAVYEQLNIQAAPAEHQQQIAQLMEEDEASLRAAERAAHLELNAARNWAAREGNRRARDDRLNQERSVLARLAKADNDEAAPSGV